MSYEYQPPQLLIDGEFLGLGSRSVLPVENPANHAILGQVPVATSADLDRALDAASRGFKCWRSTIPRERGRVLKRAAGLMRERLEWISWLMAVEVGKPLAQCRWEVAVAADTLEWFAEEGVRAYGRVLPSRAGDPRFLVTKEPVGPVASFAPWNFPVDNAVRKIAAPLAAGCSCIHKPAEEAPASALAVARALVDAGLPAGVLAVVFGVPSQISEYLIASPVIRKVSFTGSVPVGKQLMQLAAAGAKRTTMELGGHAPVLVCADADVEKTLDLSLIAKYRNAGQICVSPTRFLVHASVYSRFVEGFAARARELPVGDPLIESNRMGPLAHDRRRDYVHTLVEDAKQCGARVAAGGKAITGPGYFYAPTVLSDVPAQARILREEPFGPVAVINPFDDLEEALDRANSLPFGLAAFAFTTQMQTASCIGDALEAGMVAINSFMVATTGTPFGGVKESGHGSENGIEGLEACLVTKVISWS